MKKAVIFDLDGTLINSLPDISAAMNRALEKYQLPVHELSAYRYLVGDGVINLAKRAVGNRADLFQPVLDAYRADYAINCRVNTHPYPGISQMLHNLIQMGIKICVFSNKDMTDTQSVVHHYFPDIPFAIIRGRTEDTPIKPDPAGALIIARNLGLTPDEIWYVGDTNTDMKCGLNAGMETVGVLWGFRPEEELRACGAHHIISNPAEFIALVQA